MEAAFAIIRALQQSVLEGPALTVSGALYGGKYILEKEGGETLSNPSETRDTGSPSRTERHVVAENYQQGAGHTREAPI